MRTQSTDTSPKAEEILISLIRNASVQEKLKQTFSFSSSIVNLSNAQFHVQILA